MKCLIRLTSGGALSMDYHQGEWGVGRGESLGRGGYQDGQLMRCPV